MAPDAGLTYLVLLLVVIHQSNSKVIKQFDCTPKADLKCDLHYMSGVDCSYGTLATRFPKLYNSTDLFPNRPHEFNITNYQQEWGSTEKYYPGIRLDIGPPVDASMQDVVGFEVMFVKLDSDSQYCLIFNFSGDLTPTDVHNDLTFTGSLYPVNGETGYYFQAYSLPKPLPQYNDEGSFQYQFITTGLYGWNNALPSAHWKNSITYKNDSTTATIWFWFVEPPNIYNFTKFRVILVKGDLEGDTLKNETTVKSLEISHFADKFTDVASGWYVVKIIPMETKWPVCLCKDSNGNCLSCIATKTVPLLITRPIETTTAAEDTGYTSDSLSGGPPNPEDTSGVIIAAVLGSVLGILLAVLMLFVFLYRRERRSLNDTGKIADTGHLHYLDDGARSEDGGHVNIAYVTTVGNAVPWKIKKIFLVNTEDHARHLDTLKAFTKFLSTECRCKVVFAPFCTIEDKLRWVINSMEESDFIVLINSTAAFLQYDAWKNNKPGKYCQSLTRAGDIFGPAIQQIASRFMKNQDVHKVLSVQFDYTPDKFVIQDLCMGGQYKIIKHLDEFLCHIHGLRKEQSNLEGMGLPSVDNFTLKPTGIGLIKAIEAAYQFEKSEQLQRSDSGIDEDSYNSNDTDRSSSSLQNGQVFGNHDYTVREHDNPTEQNQRPYDYVDVHVNQSASQRRIYENSPQMRIEPERAVQNDYVEVISGDFHPPSSIGDEDIQSRQLRQEILDVNMRYEQNKLSMQDEQSLGGISV